MTKLVRAACRQLIGPVCIRTGASLEKVPKVNMLHTLAINAFSNLIFSLVRWIRQACVKASNFEIKKTVWVRDSKGKFID